MTKSQRLGLAVGHVLLWAAEQQARVDDMVPKNSRKNTYWQGKPWLKNERERQETKLVWRQYFASRLRSLDMTLRIRDRQEHIIAEGRLLGIDPEKASIVIANLPFGNPSSVTFAQRQPFPDELRHRQPPLEDLKQSYFGHQLIVNFEVISIPHGNENLIQ